MEVVNDSPSRAVTHLALDDDGLWRDATDTVNGLRSILSASQAVLGMPNLPAAARLVLASLCLDTAERPEGYTYTEDMLAADTAMTRHQVRHALSLLRADGWVERLWGIDRDTDRPAPVFRLAVRP